MPISARLLPLFTRLKVTADEILQMNQQNMMEANNKARRSASHARRQMYVLVFFGTALAAAFIVLTRRWILQPIRRLIRSAEEIRGGNLDLVLPGDRRDEIGRLSEAFNDMTASLREFRRTDQARLIRIQHATQRAFDNLPDAIAVIDPQGRVELATEPARKMFGLKPGTEVIGLEAAWLPELYAEAMRTGRPAALSDHRLIQEFLEGDERYFRPEAIPILDSQRLTAGVVLVIKDVTQLRQQDDLKRGVIRTVSHQLKTPLTSIRMAIHLLLEEKVGPLTEKQAELLLTAREDSDRLNAILSNLLDISRIESGKAQLEFRAVSPRTILAEAREPLLRAAQDQGVNLLLAVEDDLPQVWVDTTRIGYVFANLLTNALKYAAAGGTITLSARAEEAGVRFAVSDTGPGIPAQYIGRVFEPFFRVPGTRSPRAPVSAWPSSRRSSRPTGGRSSPKARKGKAPPSVSPCAGLIGRWQKSSETHERPSLPRGRRRFFRVRRSLCPGLRKAEAMTDLIGFIIGLLLILYLLYVVLKPERF